MMLRAVGTLITFFSVFLFPWPLTALFAVATALFEPLVPLSVGIFADVLYYTPQVGTLPLFTLYGAAVSIIMMLVRSRLKTGIIGE